MIFGHAPGNVCVMMLYRKDVNILLCFGETSGQIAWVQVVNYGAGTQTEELLQARQSLLKELKRLIILHIAQVLAQDRVVVLGQTKGVLQLSPASQNIVHGRFFRPTRRAVSALSAPTACYGCGCRDGSQDGLPTVTTLTGLLFQATRARKIDLDVVDSRAIRTR